VRREGAGISAIGFPHFQPWPYYVPIRRELVTASISITTSMILPPISSHSTNGLGQRTRSVAIERRLEKWLADLDEIDIEPPKIA
jgi:hypothetical protein